jgi:hypothetical protein
MDVPSQFRTNRFLASIVFMSLLPASFAVAQDPLETPLEQELLTLLSNEVSGQMAFNNLVKLAGAPWMRDHAEFSDTFYEAEQLLNLVHSYGIETVRLDRYPGSGTFSYPTAGEFWIVEPEPRRVAHLQADVALIATGSQSGKVTGELVYLPPMTAEQIEQLNETGAEYAGKVALMWSHPRGDLFESIDALGISAVVSFNSRDRYLDPNEVVYSRGGYQDGVNLHLGMTVSWRQWSELLEDVERGQRTVVRLRAELEDFPNKYETVFAWIPGTEPEAKGVMFTGHLFEGYTKRGTNDNMGGRQFSWRFFARCTVSSSPARSRDLAGPSTSCGPTRSRERTNSSDAIPN